MAKPNPVNSWTYQGHCDRALDLARQRLREAHDSTWVNSTRLACNHGRIASRSDQRQMVEPLIDETIPPTEPIACLAARRGAVDPAA